MQKKQRTPAWGFDTKNIDFSIRPQDDFYHFANGGWIKRHTIPPDESRWGSFNILRYNTEQQLHSVVTDILKKKHHPKGSSEQLIADMYLSALSRERQNRGMKPLFPLLERVRGITTTEELLTVMAEMHRAGISVPWELYLDQDSKNSAHYLLHLTQDGIGLPERDYYLSNKPEQRRVRDAYMLHVKKLLSLSGMSASDANKAVKTVMKLEKAFAYHSMKKEDARDTEKTYHKKTIAELAHEYPLFNWKRYFALLGAPHLKEVNVSQPLFFRAATKMLATIPLNEWRVYLEWHCINECAPLLSAKFVETSFAFYGTVLTGSKQMRAPWRRALSAVNGNVGEALGQLYVKRYFTQQAKKRVEKIVEDLFSAYADRIKMLDWMSKETKKKALGKLRAMNRKIGYPEKFETYTGLYIDKTDFFGNVMRAQEFQHKKLMRRLTRAVDRKEWFMNPQTVNAYCHFNLNEIVFPAAILQAPFFLADADDAINYGAIGSVIGHEITHGFDDQGSKFDGKGNLRSWWGAKDKNKFQKKAAVLVAQFNAYEIADGMCANGKLTLGENIADLGGVSIAYDAFKKHSAKKPYRVIDGWTPEQRFFLGFAQSEQEVARPEFRKMLSLIDPHSAALHRVNGPVSNLDAFYEAFEVTQKDALYRPPHTRAKIW